MTAIEKLLKEIKTALPKGLRETTRKTITKNQTFIEYQPGDGTRYPVSIYQLPREAEYVSDARVVIVWWDDPMIGILVPGDSPKAIQEKMAGYPCTEYTARILFAIVHQNEEDGQW